jgi:hypothetical protein
VECKTSKAKRRAKDLSTKILHVPAETIVIVEYTAGYCGGGSGEE